MASTTDSISCALIAHNEEANIARAIESVLWADEIVVVDCGSTDATASVLRRYESVRVLRTANNPNIKASHNLAIEACSSDWILVLDADEEVTGELRDQIGGVLCEGNGYAGFDLLRINYFLSKPLKYSMNHPDYVRRLFRRGSGRFPAVHVHEGLALEGPAGRLEGRLFHYPYPTIESYLRKLEFYTTFEANAASEGRSTGATPLSLRARLRRLYWTWVPFKPLVRFVLKYFFRFGFLDGKWGFHYCVLSAFSDYVVQLKKAARRG